MNRAFLMAAVAAVVLSASTAVAAPACESGFKCDGSAAATNAERATAEEPGTGGEGSEGEGSEDDGNNGHGNDADGNDSSNPGKSDGVGGQK